MSFTLDKAQLWRHIKVTTIALPLLKAKKNDTEDCVEKIFIQQEKIAKFEDNARKAITQIGKMCIDMVQKKFLSVKTSSK